VIEITESVSIPEEALEFQISHSGGPGGQNVNKVSTRVMIRFDLRRSPAFTDEQKRRIEEKLGNRMTQDGVLLVVSNRFRSQAENRRDVIERFVQLIRNALRVERKRVKTKVPSDEKRKRVDEKRLRSRIKSGRQALRNTDD